MIWWLIPLVLISWAVVWFMGYMHGETCGYLQHMDMARAERVPRCSECGDKIEAEDAEVHCTDCGGAARLVERTT